MWSRRQDGSFLAYSADVNATIEQAYQSGAPSVIVAEHTIVFGSMRQVQTKDESLWRPVRRAAASDDEPPPKRSRVEPPPAVPPPAARSALDAFFDDDEPAAPAAAAPAPQALSLIHI